MCIQKMRFVTRSSFPRNCHRINPKNRGMAECFSRIDDCCQRGGKFPFLFPLILILFIFTHVISHCRLGVHFPSCFCWWSCRALLFENQTYLRHSLAIYSRMVQSSLMRGGFHITHGSQAAPGPARGTFKIHL